MSISIILPAYQEAENLKEILPSIQEAIGTLNIDSEIIVVDTMEAMDNTKEICVQYGAKYVNRRGGNFYGDAIRTGIKDAQFEKIVIMDADGSHDPKEIPRMSYEADKHGYDLVIGSRYIHGGMTHNGLVLRLMSKIVNIAYRVVFNLQVKDVSNSFRFYDAAKLKSLTLECQNFDIVEEILIRLKIRYPDIKIKEVPIYFNKRVYGKSKRDLVKFICSYLATMLKLYAIKRQEKKKI